MKALRLLAAVAAAHSLGACASILSGTSQEITVDSNPRGADCELVRQEEVLARVHTPETITVKKTKHDINVSCSKEGYQVSREHLKSKIQDATWGNIVAGGGIGWAIDSASGADNKYDDHVTVTLIPEQPGTPAEPVVADEATVPADNGEETQPADNCC